MRDLKRRIQQHFAADDLGPDVIAELATICEAAIAETLKARARKGGLARRRALTLARRREIARRANRARRSR